MIKNIIFDLNGVLVTFKYSKDSKIYHTLFRMSKYKLWHVHGEFRKDYGIGLISLKDYLKNILRKNSLPLTHLKELQVLHKKEFSEVKGIKDVLKKLHTKYRLIMLAGDGKESLRFKVTNFGFRRYFEKIYCTCHLGYLKIDPRLYKKFFKIEKIDPKECLFIDDLTRHIKAAKPFGMTTILFKNSRQLTAELKRRGII